jgi:anti-sigma factor ChrR (cupin superfamily)
MSSSSSQHKEAAMRARIFAVATTFFLAAPGLVLAQDHKAGRAMRADELQWMPAPNVLPKGAQMSVLSGDPTKAGAFTIRLKAPAGYKIPAHQHPTAERLTVISGDFHFGMADKLDETKAERIGSGGFVDLPAAMNHFCRAAWHLPHRSSARRRSARAL